MSDNQFWRNASNRLVFEMSEVPERCYGDIRNDLVEVFALVPANEVVVGLDEVFQNYRRGNAIVGLEWDRWTAFIVVATDQTAEGLVREIATYLSASRWATIHLSEPDAS